jgi:large subunit ribosomal protein L32
MAVAHATASTILSSFLPQFSTSAVSFASRTTTLKMRQLALPLLPSLSLSIPAAIQLKIPTLLGDLWESVLRAVPKKKTSYMKKRSRFMAGKALKDVTALNRCSACGHVKRAHVLCPYCVKGKPDFDKQLRNHPDNDCCRDPNLVQVVDYVLVEKDKTHGQFRIFVRNKQHRKRSLGEAYILAFGME